MVASSLGKIKVSVETANKKGDEEVKLKQEKEEKEKQRLAEKKVVKNKSIDFKKSLLCRLKKMPEKQLLLQV